MIEVILALLLAAAWDTGDMVALTTIHALAGQSPDTTSAGREAFVKDAVLRDLGGQGFFDAAFETTFADSERVVRLCPGRQYRVARIVVDGAAVSGDVCTRLEGLAGSPWDARAIRAGLAELLRAHEEAGYPFAELGVRHYEADSATAGVRLRIGVTKGPRTLIQGLEVPDGIRTSGRVAARLAGIRIGVLYRQSVIEEAVSRLRKTGYFATVGEPTLGRGSSPDGVVVRIPLVERATHRARGAVGFSRNGSVVGSLQATLRNIAGTAREGSLSWEGRGEGRTDLRLTYREPWILGLPPSLDLAVSQVVEDTLWVEREGSAGLMWDLGGGVLGGIGYRSRRVIPGTEDLPASRSDEAWGQAVWDREQIEELPPGGHWVGLVAGYRTLRDISTGIETPVVRVELEVRRSCSLGHRLRLTLGGVGKLAVHGDDELPLPERFPVGGARTVRGYREGQFRTDGAGWLATEIHLASPSSASSLFLFVDGGAYRTDGRYEGLLGYGPGIMARTSLGLAEVAYGIPRGSEILQGRIHLSLGREF